MVQSERASRTERMDNVLMMEEKLLSVKEVAQALGISEATVKRWLTHKIVPGVKLGRQWRIKQSTLDSLKERGTQTEEKE